MEYMKALETNTQKFFAVNESQVNSSPTMSAEFKLKERDTYLNIIRCCTVVINLYWKSSQLDGPPNMVATDATPDKCCCHLQKIMESMGCTGYILVSLNSYTGNEAASGHLVQYYKSYEWTAAQNRGRRRTIHHLSGRDQGHEFEEALLEGMFARARH